MVTMKTAGPEKPSPISIPPSLLPGRKNHIFIAKGIRSVGLQAKKQTLFTTNNPEIPLEVWVREVLKGSFGNYLEETAAAYRREARAGTSGSTGAYPGSGNFTRRSSAMKPAGKRSIPGAGSQKPMQASEPGTICRKKSTSSLGRSTGWKMNTVPLLRMVPDCSRGKRFRTLMHRACISGSNQDQKLKNSQECVAMFSRWEASFQGAISSLEREFP